MSKKCDYDNLCSMYTSYITHKRKLTKARTGYDKHVKLPKDEKHIYVAADLEKDNMHPRREQFKEEAILNTIYSKALHACALCWTT